MSSLLVCTQPATGNPAPFVSRDASALLQRLSAAVQLNHVVPASRLEIRPAPKLVPSGIWQLEALTGGLPRGCLTEIYGAPSSGRTSILLSVMAAATQRQEACALVDVSNALDPHSAAAAGIDLQQLLWVRCTAGAASKNPQPFDFAQRSGKPSRFRQPSPEKVPVKADMNRMAQALKVTDLLVQSGGFGLIAIDLGDLPEATARRIPLASWFRFCRAVENTPTVLLVMSQAPCARTCASLLLRLEKQSSVVSRRSSSQFSAFNLQLSGPATVFGRQITVHNFPNQNMVCRDTPAHARLLEGTAIRVELERSRLDHKPTHSDKTAFSTRTAWYG